MHRNDRVSWFAITLAIILVMGSIMPILDFVDTYSPATDTNSLHRRDYVQIVAAPHDPIVIDGDANFSITASTEGWPGDGSFGNPYIIDGLGIDRGGSAGHCISISNTRANFTIRNCNLTGASANAGIFLNNVSHGSLINNTSTLNRYGIYLVDSSHNTIANNTCNANSDGINARSAVSNTFENNTCNGNGGSGIQIWDRSCGNILSRNICDGNRFYGISIHNDDSLWLYAIVADNTCSNSEYGIWAAGSYINVVNNVVTDNEIRGIYAEFSEGTITNNIVKRCYEGILLFHGDYIALSQNEISEGDWGIWLEESSENMISQNSITEIVQYGIFADYNSYMNTILLNEIAVDYGSDYMEFVGIYLTSSTDVNNVTLNHILHAPWHSPDHHAMRDDSSWDNLIDRNWYEEYGGDDDNGDGYGDTPYDIFGSAGNQDLRPLMYPPFAPTWVELPNDQVIDYWSQPFYYDLNATAPSAMTWAVNDTAQFIIDSNGILQSSGDLPVGSYGLSVKVTNFYGVYITTSFQLTVQEITPPEWIDGPLDLVINFGEGIYYGLIAMDQSGIAEWVINDT
ncbi:MAG: NosD domain-containing protein, partial [Candidatus Thorarchaeota archaeon]